jgi:hypothetical protein
VVLFSPYQNWQGVVFGFKPPKTTFQKFKWFFNRTWCGRVGNEYDSTMRTKTTIDRTATVATTPTPRRKQNDNENKRPSSQKQKDDPSKPYKLLIERVEGNYLMTIDQKMATIAPTKMTKAQRVDESNYSKQKC